MLLTGNFEHDRGGTILQELFHLRHSGLYFFNSRNNVHIYLYKSFLPPLTPEWIINPANGERVIS